MRVNANANADERTQANARTHLNNAEFYVPGSDYNIENARVSFGNWSSADVWKARYLEFA